MKTLFVSIILGLSGLSTSIFAQEETFEVRVEKADSPSGHSADFEWELTTEHGTRLDFVCPMSNFSYRENPHILYYGHENQYVGKFTLDAKNKCNVLNEYLRGVSYQIDPINPIIIKFNRRTKEVQSITFPELDPYDLNPNKQENEKQNDYNRITIYKTL